MERIELLKSVGFSDEFLSALKSYEEAVPELKLDLGFQDTLQSVESPDVSGRVVIDKPNDNYTQH